MTKGIIITVAPEPYLCLILLTKYTCFFLTAKAFVDGVMTEDLHPKSLAVIVANDNFKQCRENEPPLDAERSCSILKDALEINGVMVISVINRSRQYFLATLKSLREREIPKSCELFWLIFIGHGSKREICMNNESICFTDLFKDCISKIDIKYMVCVFECCQLGGEKIEVHSVKKEYMCLYSCPPDGISIHVDGVGLLTTCMTKKLKSGNIRSLYKFHDDLRSDYMEELLEMHREGRIKVPEIEKDHEEFKNRHLPFSVSSICHDICLSTMTSNASKLIIVLKVHGYIDNVCL